MVKVEVCEFTPLSVTIAGAIEHVASFGTPLQPTGELPAVESTGLLSLTRTFIFASPQSAFGLSGASCKRPTRSSPVRPSTMI